MDIPRIIDIISPEELEAVIASVQDYLHYDLLSSAPVAETLPTLNEILKEEVQQLEEFDPYDGQVALIVRKSLGGIVEIEYDVSGPLTTSYGTWDCDIEGPWFLVEGKRLPEDFVDDTLRKLLS